MEELVKFTLLTRDHAEYLVDRYSERRAEGRPTDENRLGAIATAYVPKPA
jgi:arsenic resistance protein ArsH